MKAGFLILMMAFVFSMPAKSAELPTLTWAFSSQKDIPDSVSNFLIQEKHYLVKKFIANLPGYNHVFLYGNVVRIEHELKQTQHLTCFPASSTMEERRRYAYLTAEALYPTPSLILRKDLANKLKNKEGKIPLKNLVTNKELRGIAVKSRSYGAEIDHIINGRDSLIQRQVLEPFAPNLIFMIQNKRADYTIEYSFLVDGLKAENKTTDDVGAYPIADVKPAIYIYLACTRTPEGLAIIEKADRIIRDNILSREYKESLIKTTSGAVRIAYEKELNQFIQTRSKRSDVH